MNFRQVQQVLLLLLEFKVLFGQLNITSYGSLSVGSSISLNCDIPSFTSAASWTRNVTILTECSNDGFCTIESKGSYSFTANSTGISVRISPLEISENDVTWKCAISGEEAYFEIILPLPSTPSTGDQDVSDATRNLIVHHPFNLYVCLSMAMFAIYQYG